MTGQARSYAGPEVGFWEVGSSGQGLPIPAERQIDDPAQEFCLELTLRALTPEIVDFRLGTWRGLQSES